jgi:hypothetical protein
LRELEGLEEAELRLLDLLDLLLSVVMMVSGFHGATKTHQDTGH